MKVLVRGAEREYKIGCGKCNSLLEYTEVDTFIIGEVNPTLDWMAIQCPVCSEIIHIKAIGK